MKVKFTDRNALIL